MNKVREGYKMTELGEIPKEWEVRTIEDIFSVRKESFNPRNEDECDYIGLEHIEAGTGRILEVGKSTETLSNKSKFYKNDILFGKLRPYLRKYWYSNIAGVCSTEILPLQTNNNYNSLLGFYLIQNENFIEYINTKTFGTKMPRASWDDMKGFKVTIPKLKKEQEKIASILSTVDEQIDNVDELIEKNKELKKGLMQQLLTKGIGHTKFKKTEIGEIPKEWEIVKFKEITDILRCGVASTPTYVENGIPFLSAQNVNNEKLSLHKYNFISEDYHKQLTKNDKPQKGDILYSRVGANYGIAAVVDVDFEFSVYVSLTLIRMKSEYDSRFYKYLLNSNIIRKQADIGVFQGGGVPNLNVKVVEKFNVVVPPKYEQIKIATILSEVDEKIEEYENKKQKLEELKKGLMQHLLTGKIRVNNI